MTFLISLARQLRPALITLIVFTVVCGLAYPLAVWGVSRLDSDAAEGSPLRDRAGCVVGSSLLADANESTPGDGTSAEAANSSSQLFFSRPTGGPSNEGPSNPDLASTIGERRQAIAQRENTSPDRVPADAVTGSGSGVDPDISLEYAQLQVPRVARNNALTVQQVQDLISGNTLDRTIGVLGESAVRVTTLNIALGVVAPQCATG